jgi:hypothetical protein
VGRPRFLGSIVVRGDLKDERPPVPAPSSSSSSGSGSG